MQARTTIQLVLLAATMTATVARAQEPRTDVAARTAAVRWLRDHQQIPDTARLVATSDEAWYRFVRCENPTARVGCAIIGDKPITLVEVRMQTPDTALIILAQLVLRTHWCPSGPPLDRPIMGDIAHDTFLIEYAHGAWGNMRPHLRVRC